MRRTPLQRHIPPFLLSIRNTEPTSGDVVAMLQAANAIASPTQSLVLLPLIAKAREVHDQLRALIEAATQESQA